MKRPVCVILAVLVAFPAHASSTLYSDPSTGEVGIGTSSPAGTLDVEGGTASSGDGTDINIYAQNGQASGNTNGGNIILMPGSANGAGTAGSVAIGTTGVSAFPAAQLQVETGTNLDNTTTAGGEVWNSGSVAANDNRSLAQYDGGAITFQGIYDSGGDYSTYGWIRGFKNTATSGDADGGLLLSTRDGNMVFKTQTTSGTLDDLTTGTSMVITSGGNVGIGTSTPVATLDVNGIARLALNSSAPATCGSSNEGAIALTHLAQVCVCDTTPAWHVLNTATACSW